MMPQRKVPESEELVRKRNLRFRRRKYNTEILMKQVGVRCAGMFTCRSLLKPCCAVCLKVVDIDHASSEEREVIAEAT